MGVRVGNVGVRVGDTSVRVQAGQLRDELPHLDTSRVRVAMRPANHLRVRAHRETVEHNPASLRHDLPQPNDVSVEGFERGLEEDRIVYRRNNRKPVLMGHSAGKPQHLCAIGLHRKVRDRRRPGVGANVETPAEHGVEVAIQGSEIAGVLHPFPILRIRLLMGTEELFPTIGDCTYPARQGLLTHPELHPEHHGLADVALDAMRCPGCTSGSQCGTDRKVEVGIAICISLQHPLIPPIALRRSPPPGRRSRYRPDWYRALV